MSALSDAPKWMRERIENLQRLAKLQVCPSCGADVWCGLDEDVAAWPAIADAQPVSTEDGLRAVLEGRNIYSLAPAADGKELWIRDEWTFGETRWPCVVQHQCPPQERPSEQPPEPRQPTRQELLTEQLRLRKEQRQARREARQDRAQNTRRKAR